MKTITTLILLALCANTLAGTIPGLTPTKVKASFGDVDLGGVTTRFSTEQTEHVFKMESEGSLLTLTLFGPPRDENKIEVISATALTYSDDQTAQKLRRLFLMMAASAPYAGNKAEEARQWVAANIDKGGERLFGGVRFRLMGSGQTRILRISVDAKPPAPVIAEPVLPPVGTPFDDVVKVHGKPKIQDADTGWAIWTGFKVKFKDGAVVEASRTPSS